MACKICGKGACCPSFHSLKDQEEWDRVYGEVYEKTKAMWAEAKAKADTDHNEGG